MAELTDGESSFVHGPLHSCCSCVVALTRATVSVLRAGTTVLLHEDGTVRIWELDYDSLVASRAEWRRMLGMEETNSSDGGKLQISVLDEDGNPLSEGEGKGDGQGEGEGSGSGKGEGEGEGKGKGGIGEGEGGSGGLRGGQEIGSARGSKAERVTQVEDAVAREISEEAEQAAAEMAAQALAKRLEDIVSVPCAETSPA
jgi:von Willebrand factor A domain-containing protein 8